VTRLAIGTYAKGGGPGLMLARLEGDMLVADEVVPGIANASFGLHHQGIWYFVDEAAGQLSAHAGPNEGWPELARVPSGGKAPCHLALHPSGRSLAAANYESGIVALIPLDDADLPGAPVATHQDAGRGPDQDRQEGPHAHWVGYVPGSSTLLAIDLGADRVFAFGGEAFGSPSEAYRAPAGSGPRHIAFHPSLPLAYLVSELASTLTILRLEGSAMVAQQIAPTLPAEAGESLGGAILLNRAADRLFVSNRGHDSVATFAVDAEGGVTLLGHTATGGASPRFLLELGEAQRLLVAHEEGGGVTMLSLAGPLPERTGAAFEAPGACFLIEVEDDA
jgi:6-phosphogluconolactonase